MRNIFAFGDSIMKGVVAVQPATGQEAVGYRVSPENFVSCCSQQLGCTIVNMSRFGSTVIGGLRYIERHLSRIQAHDMVVLEFGGNDCNFDWKSISEDPDGTHYPQTDLRQFSSTYSQMLNLVEKVGAKPVLLSLPELDSRLFFNHVSRDLNPDGILRWLGGDVNSISRWHEQYNLEVFKLGGRRGVRVIDISSVFLRQHNLSDFYCSDGMHPNEKGHRLISQAIVRELGEEWQSAAVAAPLTA